VEASIEQAAQRSTRAVVAEAAAAGTGDGRRQAAEEEAEAQPTSR
jgi:hypothetical protein